MVKKIMLLDQSIAKMVKWDGSEESLKEIQELLPNVTIKRDDKYPDKQINLLFFGYRAERARTFSFNHIILRDNGKVDIVDEKWLERNTLLYNGGSVKKTYVYFISGYVTTKEGGKGYVNREVTLDKEITSYEQISDIQKQLEKTNTEIDTFILSQYKLLRIEEEVK